MIEKKSWGETECVHDASSVQVWRIRVLPGFRCSRHYHDFKSNTFLLLSGQMRIEWWDVGGAVRHIDLSPWQFVTVPSGVVPASVPSPPASHSKSTPPPKAT